MFKRPLLLTLTIVAPFLLWAFSFDRRQPEALSPEKLSGQSLGRTQNHQQARTKTETNREFNTLVQLIKNELKQSDESGLVPTENPFESLITTEVNQAQYVLEINIYNKQQKLYGLQKRFKTTQADHSSKPALDQHSSFCSILANGCVSGGTSYSRSTPGQIRISMDWKVTFEKGHIPFQKDFIAKYGNGGIIALSENKRITWLFLKKPPTDFYAQE